MEEIYLDAAATTPMSAEVLKTIENFQASNFGNPSSLHELGRKAREALSDARNFIAKSINANPEEIIFTSGATEANNLALFGVCKNERGKFLGISAVEHPSVLKSAQALADSEIGFEIFWLY